MKRIYRLALATLMILLLGFGVWYVYSCFRQQNAYQDAILVRNDVEGERYGAGNDIY